MNFYDFHIGDYASRTAHLEPMEDLAYRRMLDLYYVRETPLPLDLTEICRLIRLRGLEDTVRAMLGEFFRSTTEGWMHDKCEQVIAAAQDKRVKAQASAAKRWGSDGNANAMPTHCEGSRDAMPTECEGNAPSPSPSPTTQKKERVTAPTPDGVPDLVWKDFQKTRKTKLTDTALEGIRREAEKAGITLEAALRMACERGWQSFKAIWLEGKSTPGITVPGPSGRDPALQKLDDDAKRVSGPSLETLARMAELRKGAH